MSYDPYQQYPPEDQYYQPDYQYPQYPPQLPPPTQHPQVVYVPTQVPLPPTQTYVQPQQGMRWSHWIITAFVLAAIIIAAKSAKVIDIPGVPALPLEEVQTKLLPKTATQENVLKVLPFPLYLSYDNKRTVQVPIDGKQKYGFVANYSVTVFINQDSIKANNGTVVVDLNLAIADVTIKSDSYFVDRNAQSAYQEGTGNDTFINQVQGRIKKAVLLEDQTDPAKCEEAVKTFLQNAFANSNVQVKYITFTYKPLPANFVEENKIIELPPIG